jgi:uncharacterized SAM-binding protein YcdF (DUF218 family)
LLLSISREIWPIGEPSRILPLAIVATALWSIVASGRARILLAMVAAALLFIAVAPVGYWLLIPLEARFPARNSTLPPTPYGIIALGGDSGHRLAALAQLSRLFPEAVLVYIGRGDRAAALNELRQEQLDPAHVILETRSRTTLENAAASAKLVKPSPDELWLLITSAAHMPRAIGCFRGAGFRVAAYPVDFVTRDGPGPPGFGGRGPAPLGEQRLVQLDDAVKEWIGLAAYRVAGGTSALFPAP